MSLMLYRALIYSSFNAISGFRCTSVLRLIKAVLMKEINFRHFQGNGACVKGPREDACYNSAGFGHHFYLSWWKSPWNICRPLWVCEGHSPTAQWSVLYGLYRGVFARGEGEKKQDTQQSCQTEFRHRPTLRAWMEGGEWRVKVDSKPINRHLGRINAEFSPLLGVSSSNLATRH